MSLANLSKKQKTGAAVGAVALLAAILYWRHAASSKTTASSSADPNAIDPLTGMPFAQDQTTDPLTGLTYLSEAQQYGSVAAAEAAFSGATSGQGYSAGYGASSGGTAGYPTSNVGTSTTGNGFATNAQWSQAVTAGLAQLGYDPQAIGAALGAFFAQMQLTSDQAAIVQAAEAEFGPPPQGTYAIVTAPSSGGSGGSGSGGTTSGGPGSGSAGGGTTPPPAKGGPITAAPVGLHTTQVSATSAQVAWTAPHVPAGQGPLTGYSVEAYNSAGQHVNGPFTVDPGQLYANIGQLKTKTAYHVNVWADPAKSGGPHATVSFTTK